MLTHYLCKTARSTPATQHFIAKLAHATSDKPYQLTSDGFKAYVKAVKTHLSGRVSFAQLVKVYASPREGEQRYSPGEVVEAVPVRIMGNPDKRRICTSHIERQNLSIRMGMRRMTRLTNAFSQEVVASWKLLILCGLHTIISVAFTRRYTLPLRWRRGSQITYGQLQN